MDVLTAMQADAGSPIKELRVDGGATANDLMLQMQANVLQATVIRPEITETTAIGAAYLAGLAVGYWKNIDEIKKQWKLNKSFSPDSSNAGQLTKGWQKAIKSRKSMGGRLVL